MCDTEVEDVAHFFLRCDTNSLGGTTFWSLIREKIESSDYNKKDFFIYFIDDLDDKNSELLLGGLNVPFSNSITFSVQQYDSVSVRKVYIIRRKLLKEIMSDGDTL